MNSSGLAQKMLEWETRKRELDALEAEIRETVLSMGKTQTVGNVRASYSHGRRKFDYLSFVENAQKAGLLAPDSLDPFKAVSYDYERAAKEAGILLEPYSITTIDYTAAAKSLRGEIAEEIPYTQGEPTVRLSLLD